MNWIAYIFFFCVGIKSFSQNALILGDSHLVGDFGENLHKEIHNLKMFDVLSIAIGGAGSYHFVQPLKNFCCGYKVRESCINEVFGKNQKIRIIEAVPDGEKKNILKGFSSSTGKILEAYRPSHIFIVLGSNYINAHQELIQLIRNHTPSAKIYWIAPFNRLGFDKRIRLIEYVTKNESNTYVIRTDDAFGNDTIKTYHYCCQMSKNWASLVMERIRPKL